MKRTTLTSSILLLSLILVQCTDPVIIPADGLDGTSSLVAVETEPPSDNCVSGGLRISVGQDSNENGTLDSSEVTSVSFVCNGNIGDSASNLLSSVVDEGPGENCEAGGTLIAIGLDDNGNDELDQEEFLSTFFICNGEEGESGPSSLIRVSVEDTGLNCANGGLKIELGNDINENEALDQEEITSTYFVCSGLDGANGLSTLSQVTSEPGGENCSNGGLKVEFGVDQNENGTLETEEIVSENFLCNGVDGIDGLSSLIRVTPESVGVNCENGGLKIDLGLDSNVNTMLDDEEVEYTYYVCNGSNGADGNNGADGLNTLISVATEAPGTNCSNGGLQITIGLDSNRNGSIDDDEELGVYYVCHGNNGADGSDGNSVIMVAEPAGSACANGGTSLIFGYDGNGDGDLSDVEDDILETITICNGLDGSDGTNGSDGYNTIIITTTEPAGSNCINGGLAFQIGLDANGNNLIDTGEEVGTYYVCNGEDGSDGRTSLVSISSFSGSQHGCASGGLIIQTGIDDDGDGVLDIPAEVDATAYVCNGDDGSNGASDDVFEFYFSEGLDGYSGVSDASITDLDPAEVGETFSVDELSRTDSHGLLHFPEIDKMSGRIGTTQFEIVEAILYLRGVSVDVDAATEDNWLGVKTLRENAPLFVEEEVDWVNANNAETWSSQGANVTEDQGAYDYSDMFRLPQGIQFQGYIPLLLNRNEVASWSLDPSNNKGLVLTMVDTGAPYELDVFSSNYKLNPSFRPLLYIKAKVSAGSGRKESGTPIEEFWGNFSYEQKLAPLKKALAK